MHELPVTERILGVVLRHAAANNVTKVVAVNLRIGELTDLLDEWLQRYFDYLSRGSVAEGAMIRVERTPVRFRCNGCTEEFPVDMTRIQDIECPSCAGHDLMLISGREFFIKDIEVV